MASILDESLGRKFKYTESDIWLEVLERRPNLQLRSYMDSIKDTHSITP